MVQLSMPVVTRRRLLIGAGVGTLAQLNCPLLAVPRDAFGWHRGLGLHNLLNWPITTSDDQGLHYAWPPFVNERYQITYAELSKIRKVGFDFARLTIDPSIFITATEERWPVLERDALDIIRRLLNSDLSVVVDLHPVAVNPTYRPEALVDPLKPEIFNAYVAFVERIATLLRGLPPDRVALEPFNEPWISNLSQAPRWQAMLERLHSVARTADSARPIVLNGLQWDSIAGLQALDPRPFRGSSVLYTFHYYDPHAFTHQGVQGDTKWLSGLRWPEDDRNAQTALDRGLKAINSDGGLAAVTKAEAARETKNYVTNLLRSHPGQSRIADDFSAVSSWGAAHGIAPQQIILGEFGCVSDPKSEPADRLAWLRAVRSASEAAGFGWAYWAYKGNSGMSLIDDAGRLDLATLAALGMA